MKPTAGESWSTCLALTPPHHRVAVTRPFRHRLKTKYGEEDDGRQETVYTAVHATVQPTSALSLAPVFLQSQQRRGGHLASEVKWPRRFERILGARTFRSVSNRLRVFFFYYFGAAEDETAGV